MRAKGKNREDLVALLCVAIDQLAACGGTLQGCELGREAFRELLARAEQCRRDVGDKIAALVRRSGGKS